MQSQNLGLIHLVRQPSQPTERPPLLVLLHGYGANEADLFSFASYLDPSLLIISARAPLALMPSMFAWFQIGFTNTGMTIDRPQAEAARDTLVRFVEEAIDAYAADPARVYLLGFSQGAIMSAAVLLKRPELVAGAVLMSGSVTPDLLPPDLDRAALTDKPVLITHGTHDTVLPVQNGRTSREIFAQLPVALVYREYPMGHEVNAQNLVDVANWLQERLAGDSSNQ